MKMEDAVLLAKKQIETGECHADYAHVVNMAETYKIYITGAGIEKKLIQYTPREDRTLFEQRTRLTKSITPAVSSSIRQPFNKVTRNDRIRKSIELKNAGRKQALEQMMLSFYGGNRKKSRGLEYWLKTRFVEMQFIDPNSWVVVEWDAAASADAIIKPRPFEVNSTQARNFFIVNDDVKWLFVEQDIFYKSKGQASSTVTTGAGQTTKEEKKAGKRFTLYDEDVTIVYEQIEPGVYEMQAGEKEEKIKDVTYVVRRFEPKVGYVPAFRIGYKRDEETSGRTFVNPWHDALCFFDKSVKTVSELDLTMTLHVFPQKLQYVQKCAGQFNTTTNKHTGCNLGFVQGKPNVQCPECKGRGIKIHTTAQDAIFLPMPDNKADMIPLDDILVYKSPPIELIKFQNEYTQQLERQAHRAVFNSQVFVTKAGGGMTEQKTATEADFNMQAVYDSLEPFTEKLSEIWREFVTIFAVIAGEPIESVDVSHDFPADYKLKTSDILLTERKTASESGAPAFFIETIDDDLATITYQGDALGLAKYRVKRRYFPFSGKNEDEVALLLSSEFVPKEPKILYSNFDLIFRELESENPDFWLMTNIVKQRDLVIAKVAEWKERLKADAPAVSFDMFRGGAASGGSGSGSNTGGNQGNNSDQNAAGAAA